MTPSIRRTAIKKKANVVNIAVTSPRDKCHMVGNDSLPPNLGGETPSKISRISSVPVF
jgi:hypothetical protein